MTSSDFEKIVHSTKKVVLASISKYLVEEYSHAIDDVVQETYIRAFKSLSNGKFRGDSEISTWLYVIARNESYRMNAKLEREENKKEKLKNDINMNKKKGETNSSNTYELIIYFLTKIPEKYAFVLEGQLFGKTEKDIAGDLGISKGTVKSRASRGKEFIRKLIKRGEIEDGNE